MGFADNYLLKQSPEFLLTVNSLPRTGICIVIPCFNEPDLITTLNSLWGCLRPTVPVVVIIVINSSESADQSIIRQNDNTLNKAEEWIQNHVDKQLIFNVLNVLLPDKAAGVGFARKVGMDAAVKLFNDQDNKAGIIVNLDADCTVERNYLVAIENSFRNKLNCECATLYFEHDLTREGDQNILEGIIRYELHLRYLTEYSRYIDFPYSFFTIGSCFAVTCARYIKQGGMNRKQAGEDFYFLHKIFPTTTTIEINSTVVYPSPRISSRVPFGTGAAMKKFIEKSEDIYTYNPRSYEDLKLFIQIVPLLYNDDQKKIKDIISSLPPFLINYLDSINVYDKIDEIRGNTSNKQAFIKRVYSWFNAFVLVKYLNYSSGYFEKLPVFEAAGLLAEKSMSKETFSNVKDLLMIYRKHQRNENYISPL